MNNDFSDKPRVKRSAWRLLLGVLAAHVALVLGFEGIRTSNLGLVHPPVAVQAAIVMAEEMPLTSARNTSIAESTVYKSETGKRELTIIPPEVVLPLAASTPVETMSILVSQPLQAPMATKMEYQLVKGHHVGKAHLAWKTSAEPDGQMVYEVVWASSLGSGLVAKQVSLGKLGDSMGLQPIRFSDKRRGKSEQATHFERDKGTVAFSNNRQGAQLPQGVQDRASLYIQLASQFAADPQRYKAGEQIVMPVASTSELESWVFEVYPREMLSLPIGERDAVKLLRRPSRPFEPMTELWLAPSEQWLPVRIRLTDSSGVTDHLLVSSERL